MLSIQPRSPGSPTSPPSYTFDGSDSGQLWLTTEAVHTYGVRTVYANAWSAPGYMKTNRDAANGGSLGGVPGTSCGDWRRAYADYLVQYLRYHAAANITVTHPGFLNEPDLTTSYASMRSTPQQAASFMGVLRSAVADASDLVRKPLLTCCDTMSWAAAPPFIAAAAPDVATAHAYTSSPTSPLGKVKTWMTEAADNNGAWTSAWYSNGGAGEGLTWANNIHAALTQGNVSAYLYWIGAQDRSTNTNSKLIRVIGTTGEGKRVEASKRLWAMAGWSRFVRPRVVRVGGRRVK